MTDHTQNNVYVMIAGPTAAGKSSLALELAELMDGEIINADSMQLYADLRVVTARPDAEEEARIPHHLYGVVDGGQRASVAAWLEMAAGAIADVRGRGRIPVIVGGTGMYLSAGLTGIAPIPDVPDDIHQSCMQDLGNWGGAAFREALGVLDAETAERLFDGDSQRLVRAMGVVRATGRPISAWQRDPHQGALPGTAFTVAVLPPRQKVYDAIDRRFEKMMEEGAQQEVARLGARELDPGLPVMKAIGVREILAFQRGEISRLRAIELASRDSRHYAKRQLTWLRNNFHAQYMVNEKYSKSIGEEIFSILSKTS